MTPKKTSLPLSRRAVVQAMMAAPALALFHENIATSSPAAVAAHAPDGVVEINGWILKRSEVA